MRPIGIILFIGVGHLCAGVAIWIDPKSGLVTPLYEVVYLTDGVIAPLLISAGALAIASTLDAIPVDVKIFMIIPQQTLLLLQASSLVFTLLSGHYPDGYVPRNAWPRLFIFNDQLWALFCSLAHTWEVVSLARKRGG